ncbi:hypothetical protein AURDEDRAFT_164391 [Auricularia subglabra TFB-10046 SS5]|nr:hypothetical protein AURDEDRAFT_164391 [Auricularia subglabra TFB-10046 SS5]
MLPLVSLLHFIFALDARLINFTIDDTYGDERTMIYVFYTLATLESTGFRFDLDSERPVLYQGFPRGGAGGGEYSFNQLVFQSKQLLHSQHELRMQMLEHGSNCFDYAIYTADDGVLSEISQTAQATHVLSSTPSSNASDTATPIRPKRPSSFNIKAVVGASVATAAFALAIVAWFCVRRRRRREGQPAALPDHAAAGAQATDDGAADDPEAEIHHRAAQLGKHDTMARSCTSGFGALQLAQDGQDITPFVVLPDPDFAAPVAKDTKFRWGAEITAFEPQPGPEMRPPKLTNGRTQLESRDNTQTPPRDADDAAAVRAQLERVLAENERARAENERARAEIEMLRQAVEPPPYSDGGHKPERNGDR